MQGEMFPLAASHLLASSVHLRIPEESLQDNSQAESQLKAKEASIAMNYV